MKQIEKIHVTFQGDESSVVGRNQITRDTTAQPVGGSGTTQPDTLQSMSLTFEFYPGEQLVGDIIINPNKNQTQLADEQEYKFVNGMYYFSKAQEKSVAFLKFTTSLGRTFEAGHRNHLSQDVPYVFPADKSFIAGISGYSDLNANRVISLGFNIWSFSNEYFDDLKWVDQQTDELKTESEDQGGETDMICNNSDKPKTHTFKYPSSQGAQRCTWIDHPLLDAKNIKFEKKVVMPTIDRNGLKKYEPFIRQFDANINSKNYEKSKDDLQNQATSVNTQNNIVAVLEAELADTESRRIRQLSYTLPEDNISLRTNTAYHPQAIEQGTCAKLKFDQRISKQDNAKFTFTHNFVLENQRKENQIALSFVIEGQSSMEKQVKNSLEIVINDVQYDTEDTLNNQSKKKDQVRNKSNIQDIFNEIEHQGEEQERERRDSEADTINRINSDTDLFNFIDAQTE